MAKNPKVRSFIKVYKYILFDAITIALSYLISMWMFSFMGVTHDYSGIWMALAIIIPAKIIIYFITGVYRIMSKHTGFEDFIRIASTVIVTNIIIALIVFLTDADFMFESAYIFISLIEITGLIFPRTLRRIIILIGYQIKWYQTIGIKTLIVGAGSAGEIVVKEIYKNKDLNNIPTVFVDDSPEKIGKKLMGVNIVGTLNDIDKVISKYHIEEVIIAINTLPQEKFKELVNRLLHLSVKIRKLNVLEEINDVKVPKLVDIKVEDLLDRSVIKLDNQGINDFINDETVLITGGGGSIGSELSRQIYELNPKKIIIFDIYENNSYDIQMELLRKAHKNPDHKYPELVVRIGSVYNKVRLEQIFNEFKPTIVFHAAAYKHVPLMEDSAVEAVRTNVIGTYNTATLSNQYGVKKFVLVSSDKAVRSTNIMGATKRFAELIIKDQQSKGNTIFSAVRFGNVLGSNGSVIPLFKKQIADGGPVTVTHKDITRYFMTIPEAVGLILQCGVYAACGELFVLDMGEPVKIHELAKKMIRLAGFRPDEDIKIEIVGLRPGEKLFEELLVDTTHPNYHGTANKLIFTENGGQGSFNYERLETLVTNFETLSNDEVKTSVSEIITSYKASI